jgi:pyruvate,water dikinase
VDASARTVYAGTVPGLESPAAGPRAVPEREARVRSTPVFRLLERVAELLVPLNLSDPRSPEFAAVGCRTLHDIARYVHEKSYEEMFAMGTELGDFRAASYKLDVFLPIDLYVIDLGGGLAPPARGRTIKRAHITSAPLAALLGGMLHRGIPRFGPRPIDAKGLLSIMARHAIESPDQERTFRDPCYAIVSDRYLNYAARVGYHFAAVDTYCGRTGNKNYISFQFKGGAADVLRRGRRTAAIGTILRENGFSTDVKGDLVTARLSKASAAEIQSHLDTIGRLLQFMRQLDVAMVHDGMVEQVARSFMEGKYEL